MRSVSDAMVAVLSSWTVSGYGRRPGPVMAVTDSSVLAEPDLGSMFDLPAEPHLVSSRPREPIEKRWTRTP
jgi:hypothetical protein